MQLANKCDVHVITHTTTMTHAHNPEDQESNLSLSGAAPQVHESGEVATANHKLCLKCEG